MSEFKELYILGYSGHAYVVIDVAGSMGLRVSGYFDEREHPLNPYGCRFLGHESNFDDGQLGEGTFVFPATGENALRKKLTQLIEERGWRQLVLKDASAVVSNTAQIKPSTLIAPGAIVNSFASIGKGCIINSRSIVEHECSIGSYSHIAPGAVLTGNVKVGEECFIGAGAVVKPWTRIGDGAVIGAGSIVLKDIPAGETWAGNPAKKLR